MDLVTIYHVDRHFEVEAINVSDVWICPVGIMILFKEGLIQLESVWSIDRQNWIGFGPKFFNDTALVVIRFKCVLGDCKNILHGSWNHSSVFPCLSMKCIGLSWLWRAEEYNCGVFTFYETIDQRFNTLSIEFVLLLQLWVNIVELICLIFIAIGLTILPNDTISTNWSLTGTYLSLLHLSENHLWLCQRLGSQKRWLCWIVRCSKKQST